MKELLEAGVHFGHQTRRWNPKMKRFIFTERGGIYIIDLQQTQGLLQEAHDFARAIAERGDSVLFVGTKKQAQDAVRDEARRVGMPYVNHRWLGGLLTNWRTISDRIQRLHELRSLKTESQLELLPASQNSWRNESGPFEIRPTGTTSDEALVRLLEVMPNAPPAHEVLFPGTTRFRAPDRSRAVDRSRALRRRDPVSTPATR